MKRVRQKYQYQNDPQTAGFQNHYKQLDGGQQYQSMIHGLKTKKKQVVQKQYKPNLQLIQKDNQYSYQENIQQFLSQEIKNDLQQGADFQTLKQQLKLLKHKHQVEIQQKDPKQFQKAKATKTQMNIIQKLNKLITISSQENPPFMNIKNINQKSKQLQILYLRNVDFLNKLIRQICKKNSLQLKCSLKSNNLLKYANQTLLQNNVINLRITQNSIQKMSQSCVQDIGGVFAKWAMKFSQLKNSSLGQLNSAPLIQTQKAMQSYQKNIQKYYPFQWKSKQMRIHSLQKASIYKNVQRKASKNRKIRFQVHSKLINFASARNQIPLIQGRDQILRNLMQVQTEGQPLENLVLL